MPADPGFIFWESLVPAAGLESPSSLSPQLSLPRGSRRLWGRALTVSRLWMGLEKQIHSTPLVGKGAENKTEDQQ